jgi:hypothetical protein
MLERHNIYTIYIEFQSFLENNGKETTMEFTCRVRVSVKKRPMDKEGKEDVHYPNYRYL